MPIGFRMIRCNLKVLPTTGIERINKRHNATGMTNEE